MRISSCPNSSKRHQGFTLVEILVVLIIVTILAGLVVARLPAFGSDADFEMEARRLQLLLRMARTEAVLESVEYGFRQTDEGYEFLVYNDASKDWVKAGSPFHSRRLDPEVRLTLRTEDERYGTLGSNLPPLLLLSSGETTPFRLTLESRGRSLTRVLASDGYDEIAWVEEEGRR